MSYPALFAVNVLLSAAVLGALARAAETAHRGPTAVDPERCRRQLRLAVLGAIGLLLTMSGNAWLLARLDWVFAAPIFSVHLPLLAVPCLTLLVVSSRRGPKAAPGTAPSTRVQATRSGASVWA